MGEHHRRSFLTALGMSGFLGATGIVTGVTDWLETSEAIDSTTTATVDDRVLGVEAVNRETGDRSVYGSRETVSRASLDPGEYDVVEIVRSGDQLTQRTSRLAVAGDTVGAMSTDGISLRVATDTAATHDHVAPDDTVTVWAGALEQRYGLDSYPVSDLALTVTLEDPDGNPIDAKTGTTTGDGNVRIEFELDTVPVGEYTVRVESDETGSIDTTTFVVGPYITAPHPTAGMTVGEGTTIGLYSELGGVPESGVEREFVVETPSENVRTKTVAFDGGTGLLSIVPDESGTYTIYSAETNAFVATIGSGELQAVTPYYGTTEQYVDEQGSWGGHVVDGGTPVANRDLEVTLREFTTDETRTFTTTTNDFGQFTIEFETPSEETRYEIDLETGDGESIYLFSDVLWIVDPDSSDGGDESSVDINVSIDPGMTGTGTGVTVTAWLRENGEPVANETISLLLAYTENNVPAGLVDVETDEDGMATQSIEIPADAPEDETVYVTGFVEDTDSLHSATSSALIRSYDVQIDAPAQPTDGVNTIDVSATEQATGEPAPGIDVAVFGQRRDSELETFDTGTTTTDADGEGQLELEIPPDATNVVEFRGYTSVHSTSVVSSSVVTPLINGLEITSESGAPGETVSIDYSLEWDTPTSAIARFPMESSETVTVFDESDPLELTVPGDAEPGSQIYAGVLLVDANGETFEFGIPISVTAGELPEIDVTGDGNPATDTTGDGLLDDVNGDGVADIADVQALFQNLDNEKVQTNASAFDFSGNDPDAVTTADVQALHERVSRYIGVFR